MKPRIICLSLLSALVMSSGGTRLPPVVLNMQYAGSIGLVSAGASIRLARKKLETGLLMGYLPASHGGPMTTFTAKATYNPFCLRISPSMSVQPLQTGVFVTMHTGKELERTWDKHYPDGYYMWNRSIRMHVFAGIQLSVNSPYVPDKRFAIYLECNTNDLYINRLYHNRGYMPLWDIMALGAGVKMYFR